MNVSYLHDKQGYFNSIKVRLEQHLLFGLGLNSENFNSIKVRLEQRFGHSTVCWSPNFNSIKVRLEPSSPGV